MIIYLKTDNVPKWHAALVFTEKHGYIWFRREKPTSKYMEYSERGEYLKLDINTKKLKRKLSNNDYFEADKNYIVIEVI